MPDIKEMCNNVKQCLFSLIFSILENSIFIKFVIYVNTLWIYNIFKMNECVF